MRSAVKILLPLALIGLLAIGLSACGSGDSDDSTSGSAAPAEQEPKAATTPENEESSQDGSASFRVKGGDNSIQNYGEEADSAEVDAASSVLAQYLRARAAADWVGECLLLAKGAVASLEQL